MYDQESRLTKQALHLVDALKTDLDIMERRLRDIGPSRDVTADAEDAEYIARYAAELSAVLDELNGGAS